MVNETSFVAKKFMKVVVLPILCEDFIITIYHFVCLVIIAFKALGSSIKRFDSRFLEIVIQFVEEPVGSKLIAQ